MDPTGSGTKALSEPIQIDIDQLHQGKMPTYRKYLLVCVACESAFTLTEILRELEGKYKSASDPCHVRGSF
jgi:hypothetical protein